MRNLAQMLTLTIVVTASLKTMFPDFNCVPCLFAAVFVLAVMYIYGDGVIDAIKTRRAYMRHIQQYPTWSQAKRNAIFADRGYEVNAVDKWYIKLRFPWDSP